jgi:hypothetical protein
MKHVRLPALVLVLALTFALTGGGFVPKAEANHCNGTFSCRGDGDCAVICCTLYGCDPSYPPFCDFFNPGDECGTCFC